MSILPVATLLALASTGITAAAQFKLHAIFTDHMVIQRDQPIKVWGWGQPGQTIHVKLGEETAQAQVGDAAHIEVYGMAEEYAGKGTWEVTFPAREASVDPITLQVTDRNEMLEVDDILIGDVWILYGQSNMAWPLKNTTSRGDMARAQGDLPLLREFKIQGNEQATPQDDIRPDKLPHGGWLVSTRETAGDFSGIGWHFGDAVQRATGVPIGLINAARGGAAIESMVPMHKFAEDPLAKRYAEHVEQRMAEFDPRAEALATWERQVARAKQRNRPEPTKPEGYENLRSWDIPGKSPSDRSSIYNGMLGVLKGYHVKGGLFHQGYNNAVRGNCRPKLYRVLTRLMVEGIREDFNNPDMPFCIIGFCAGGEPQNIHNFEAHSNARGAYIREAQRLGLGDVENQENLQFIPAYDVIVPGLHPSKKREHGERAARWAVSQIYEERSVQWRDTELISAEPNGDHFVVKFNSAIRCDTRNNIPEGFSIAGADGKFYMGHARFSEQGGHPSGFPREVRVWSPLVPEPVAIRYAWATSPMGNLKMGGHPDRPFPSFRTDDWDYPGDSDDPADGGMSRADSNAWGQEAGERLQHRLMEEAKRGVEILERVKTLGIFEEQDED